MTNTFLQPARPWRRLVAVTAIAVVVVAVIAAGAFLLTNAGADRATTPDADTSSPVNDSSPLATPSGPLQLLKGEQRLEGVSVGYPPTAAGGISAAAEYMAQLGSTLDLDRIRAIAPLVADASYADAEEELVQGRIDSRKQLGLPESGPVPVGASMTVGPAAFQLRSVTSESMTVLLLAYLTTIDGNGELTPRVIVMPVDMHWDGSDWKLVAPAESSRTDYSDLVAQPGTSEAVVKGWQVLTP